MNKIRNLRVVLNKLRDIQFIILMGCLSYVLIIPFVPLANLYERFLGKIGGPQVMLQSNILEAFFISVIVAPIYESAIIVLFIKILRIKIKKKKNILICTSIIFSSLHYYSIFYMIVMFIPSLIFVYSYLYYEYKKISPFYVMVFIHSIYNLFSLIAVKYS